MRLALASSTVLVLALGCGAGAPATTTSPPPSATSPSPPPPAEDVPATPTLDLARPDGVPAETTWPTEAQFAATQAALPRPWTLVAVRRQDRATTGPLLALGRREGEGWVLARLLGSYEDAALPAGCDDWPCPWPASVVPERPLEEPPALPEHLLRAVAYARTLLTFEGPLSVYEGTDEDDDGAWIPASAHLIGSDTAQEPNLAPYLERLRRYHPQGYCSMDTRPQQAAMMRALAAAQAGHAGWAVQGWLDTVGYWSSPRMVWSSYGQNHPQGHLRLLERVGVPADRLLLGILLDLPGQPATLHLADVRRVVPDLGPAFTAELRALAGDASIDPLNRALLAAAVTELPVTADPLYAQLSPESQALLDLWSR